MTFLEAANKVLEYVTRPDDFLAAAEYEINAAVRKATQLHTFKHQECLLRVNFSPSQPLVRLEDSLGSRIKEILSADIVSTNQFFGKPIYIKEFSTMRKERLEFLRRNDYDWENESTLLTETTRQQTEGWKQPTLLLVGDGVMLYPNQEVEVLMLVAKELPELVNGADTNFLLTYCYNYIIAEAANALTNYYKEDTRIPITQNAVREHWKAVLAWDASSRTAQGIKFELA